MTSYTEVYRLYRGVSPVAGKAGGILGGGGRSDVVGAGGSPSGLRDRRRNVGVAEIVALEQ
jgi:hypothetical protein